MGEVTHDRVVRTFIKIRDARHELKAAWERQDKELADQQETLEAYMLGIMNTGGMTKFSTPAGTAYRTETMVPTGSDWSAFYAWVKQTDGFDFLFRRIKADAVKEYMEQNAGEVPPGVAVYSKYGVRIRRK